MEELIKFLSKQMLESNRFISIAIFTLPVSNESVLVFIINFKALNGLE